MTIKDFKAILSRLIGNANVLSNNVLFIDYCHGNHSKAQFMSQLFYWQSKATRKDGYFFKTYEEWHNEIRVPKHSLLRYSREFKELGFLETKTKKANGFPTVHYKLDVDNLVNALVTFCNNGSSQFATNDSDNLQLTNDSDNLQLSSNKDYQRLQTDTVEQASTSPLIPFSEIIEYLNEKTGAKFRHTTKATKEKISARWREGFRLEDFKDVIDCKVIAWGTDAKMNEYLRPETLFGTKFESYLNACKKSPQINLVQDLIDIPLQEGQTHEYLNYHQKIKDKFPKLYANVRMLKASEYFDLRPGAKRHEMLNFRFTLNEIRNNIAKAHQNIEQGLTIGRSYVDVLTELNSLLRQTA